jgi:hypothetical protein
MTTTISADGARLLFPCHANKKMALTLGPNSARMFKALALAIGLWPATAAADDFFICRDSNGATDYTRIYYAQKKVTVLTGTSPSRCIGTFVDGAFGPVFSSPSGENCSLMIFRENVPLHQIVRFSPHTVTWGAYNDQVNQKYVLNTETGINDIGNDDFEECHRPHS